MPPSISYPVVWTGKTSQVFVTDSRILSVPDPSASLYEGDNASVVRNSFQYSWQQATDLQRGLSGGLYQEALPDPRTFPDSFTLPSPTAKINDRTPLLRPAVFTPDIDQQVPLPRYFLSGSYDIPTVSSDASIASLKPGGKSTFGQTLFNSIAVLLGVGMLAQPLAFAYAGWLMGTILLVSFGFISCYTAKILARIIRSEPHLKLYTDIGRRAFGTRPTLVISIAFFLELFLLSVLLVTLYADSLESLIPAYSSATYKILVLVILIPTLFFPLSVLSYTSILGIVSLVLIVVVVFVDGIVKSDAPGSLWAPAETSLRVDGWNHLGKAFGLFMAGFAGHGVLPSLVHDMEDPSRFDTMANWAFFFSTFIYLLIGGAGYFMFGVSVSEEVSRDLLLTPGYNARLNKICLWMLVVSPLSKFSLVVQPLNATIEKLFKPQCKPAHRDLRQQLLCIAQRLSITLLTVVVSIMVPDFGRVTELMGSFSAFLIVVICPIGAKIAITRACGFFDILVLGISFLVGTWGTITAFM
ncbi:transmembrane amino acid transporter protein-domain-containing protein [Armillaria luteobubalina]|uniref:Transmembrane amino acid transporter protein-domain-containing protein n=1 Tax=Armillaria luteobubalina TaxID=153913 RepID=A0AA39PBJ6_9AGAR|nr:transmembrane amino acid transporter protein-domain-containing protein [Armillaria luteobubalina]